MTYARPSRDVPVVPEQAAAEPTPRLAGQPQTIRLGRGQRLAVEGERQLYDFYGNTFFLCSHKLCDRLPFIGLTATEYDVLHTLLGNQERGGIIPFTQVEIAERLGIERQEAGRAFRRLAREGFIWRQKRGRYRINPRIAFYGTSGGQAEAAAQIPPEVPKLNLPEDKVRPPRRRRKAKES